MPDILLVEDKDSLRRVLRLTLESAGYSVTEAADASAAINAISEAPHRIVLTDLRMPNGSGLDVLHAARAAEGDVPMIVMTAFGSIDEAVQPMKDGAHDFLQKPVDSNHLLLLVERALEQARLSEGLLAMDPSGSLSEVSERASRYVERGKIAEALKTNDGNKSRTAEDLGVTYKTLLTKLRITISDPR